jgi:TRAP-type C4-dicarboxylate transport system permease small subunit
MQHLAAWVGRVSAGLAAIACALLAAMMLMICADILLRNLPVAWGITRGLPWANEISETMLYLMTMLAAPWLLRRGQHIRVDILLRALPGRVAWTCELIADSLALICCLAMVLYGVKATVASFTTGAMSIKTLVTPEWWALAVLPLAFAVLAVEVIIRMYALQRGPRAVREDAVSAS